MFEARRASEIGEVRGQRCVFVWRIAGSCSEDILLRFADPRLSINTAPTVPRYDSGRSCIPRARAWMGLFFVDLDVAFGDEASVAVREVRSGDADEKCVFARTRISIITGIYSVRVAWLLVHLGVTLERPAVA
jgi:hypothetical protein